MTRSIFETRNVRFIEDVEFSKGDNVKDFVFEEKCVIHIVAIDSNQTYIANIIQEVNPDQDNVKEPPVQNQEVVTEEKTLKPQELMTLRRSTRERRSVVQDNYIIFLQEHEIDIGIVEDDPINFCQVMESFNSQKVD